MEEVITAILDAENSAKGFIATAEINVKKTISMGEIKAEAIKEGAIDVAKAYRKSTLSKAEITAESEYNDIVEKGRKEAETFADNAREKIDSAADIIVKEIIG
ncbi:MAG: hypothetical protein E7362_05375 [Clostridiales bacterium]|nr:hypothetical protein [Clostridiales bacterium]